MVFNSVGLARVAARRLAATSWIRRNSNSAPGGFLRTIVSCPAGKVAVAGGVQVVGEGTRDFRTALQESAPGGASWLIALRNNDSGAHAAGLFAVCATAPSGYQVVRRDASIPAGGFHRTFADCPSGKVAVGGGAQVVGEGSRNFRTIIEETGPNSVLDGAIKLWVTAVSNTDSVAHTVGFFAVCVDAPSGYEVVRRDLTIAAGGFLRATAVCPAGKLVFGGGAQVLDPNGSDYRTITQERAPGSAGQSAVFLTAMRNNGPVSRTVAFNAICAATMNGYQIVQRTI